MIVMVFEIDQDLCDKVTAVLALQGLTLSDAIVLLFKKTAELGRLPFSFTERNWNQQNRATVSDWFLSMWRRMPDDPEIQVIGH